MRVDFAIELGAGDERLEIPWQNAATGSRYLDLREDPAAVEQVNEARRYVAARGFLTLVNSADSIFATARFRAGSMPGDDTVFASQTEIVFAPALEDFNFIRSHFEEVADDLIELLAKDPGGETLQAHLKLRRCHYRDGGRDGYCLAVTLSARGETSGQAELRWGLALARLQQALLFTSRVIRHYLAQTGHTEA
jgi:hypothetical protein